MTTKYKIAEEIQRLLVGGNPANAAKYHINELKISVEQVCNQLLKMDYFSANIPMGEMIPNGAAIATYENIGVEQWNNVSKSTLPCFPLKLPRNIGVYQIYPSGSPDNQFIPLETGMRAMIKEQPLVSDLSGCTGFETFGMEVIYTKDLTVTNEAITVDMRLVVLDIARYTDWEILPLAPEQEWQVKNEVFKLYMGEPIPDKLIDPGVKEQRGTPTTQQIQP